MELRKAFRLGPAPVIAFVGAGGKTTAMFRLARELTPPVLVTATTHLSVEQAQLADRHLVAAFPDDLKLLEVNFPTGVTLVTGPLDGDRVKGASKELCEWLHALCRDKSIPLLVEADGSRQRPLKAPARHEPPIPGFAEDVVVVAGLSALGKPLDENSVHRLEEYQRICESTNQRVMEGRDIISVEIVAKVMTHPGGGLKNIPPHARRIALLNQADTPGLQAQGKALAEQLLPAYHSVVIASLLPGTVIHAVVEPAAAIVLAAGESVRFGSPKQLLDFHGQPFVRAVAQTALSAGLSPVVVVTGAYSESIEAAVKDLKLKIVFNKYWQYGQSTSIREGIASLPVETGAAVFLLADQPQVEVTILRALLERHADGLPAIVAPLVRERRANPVLFDRVTFPDLAALTGDVGGRGIFGKHPVTYLPWHDASLLVDIDTPGDLEKLERRE